MLSQVDGCAELDMRLIYKLLLPFGSRTGKVSVWSLVTVLAGYRCLEAKEL